MKRTIIPQLHFKAGTTDDAISVLNGFLRTGWKGAIFGAYPHLEGCLKGVKSERRRDVVAYSYFRELQDKLPFQKKAEAFQEYWDPLNSSVMRVLSDVVEMPWPKRLEEITARVTFSPICPRYLKLGAFDVYINDWNEAMRDVALHELLHFIYFEKWKQVFPDSSEREFEHPHLVWSLSELLTVPILTDARVQSVCPHSPPGYEQFTKSKVAAKSLLEHTKEMYDSSRTFKRFLIDAYDFVKRHRRNMAVRI